MTKLLIIIGCLMFSMNSSHANTQPAVTNVVATLNTSTNIIDVSYDVYDADGDDIYTILYYSLDRGASWDQECISVSGDIGYLLNISPRLVASWNAEADIPGYSQDDIVIRVYADDKPFLPFNFARINSGSFTMGSPVGELGRSQYETQHTVTLTNPFTILSTEVTNQQYVDMLQWAFDHGFCISYLTRVQLTTTSAEVLLFMYDGSQKISFDGIDTFLIEPGRENHPVHYVTWYGAAVYCNWLSLIQGLPQAYNYSTWECNGNAPYSAQGYRLPTEAEWEYSCRAGSENAFSNGPISDRFCDDPTLSEIGWYCGSGTGVLQPVGLLNPNAWGLYDMHGNCKEWCNDWLENNYGPDLTNPIGPLTGSNRVWRNGTSISNASVCRSASRGGYYSFPSEAGQRQGFRIVKTVN